MSLPDLIIGSITIPRLASLELTQEFGEIVSEANHRMGDGTLFTQEHWAKKTTTISGSGWVPAAFQSIDYSAQQVIQCITLEAVQDASNVLTLPAARRSDAGPYGFAMVGNREVQTSISMAGNEATLGVVTGADFYLVKYYPTMTCKITSRPRRRLSRSEATYSWSFDAEEV